MVCQLGLGQQDRWKSFRGAPSILKASRRLKPWCMRLLQSTLFFVVTFALIAIDLGVRLSSLGSFFPFLQFCSGSNLHP